APAPVKTVSQSRIIGPVPTSPAKSGSIPSFFPKKNS
ncbi:unnamed protein product, partial [Oikopleura dioica]